MAPAAILSGHGAMPKGHKEPDAPESGRQQESLPMDQRLLEIRRRVERKFYNGYAVLVEVAEALMASWGLRRAKVGSRR